MTNKSFIISFLMLLVSICSVGVIYSRPMPVVVQTNLEQLPMTIAEYSATDDSFPESVYLALNADENVYRHYRDKYGKQVDLYIGYYGTAKGGRTGHNPYGCLPSSGWAIVETGEVSISSPNSPRGVTVNYIRARKDGVNDIMLHWYQTAGTRVMSNGVQMNVQRFIGRIFHNRNDGAFVRISMSADDENIPLARRTTTAFAEKILALLPSYWPVEK